MEKPSSYAGSSTRSAVGVGSKVGGGAYSRMAQAKNGAKQRDMLEKLEREKQRERMKLKEYRTEQQQRERRLAEERIKQIGIQNTRIANQKNQQREFYVKYLRQTAEKNIEKLRQNDAKYHASELPKLDAKKLAGGAGGVLASEAPYKSKMR